MTAARRTERAVFTGVLVAAAVLLVLGWTLPAIRTDDLTSADAHSIVGGIFDLLADGQVLLGLILLSFSVCFPAAKLAALGWLTWRTVPERREKLVLLAVLGKWSMLDVFVVVLFVGAVRLGVLAEFEPRVGIYVFTIAILVTMAATHGLERDEDERSGHREAHVQPRAHAWPVRVLSLTSLAAFVAGLTLPLMRIEKWLFWSSEHSLVDALVAIADEGHAVLALLGGLFVVVLPALRLVGLAWLRWIGLPPRALRALVTLEEWAMLDVFAVALLVVATQVAGMAELTPRAGCLLLLLAALTAAIDARLLRASLSR